ncbi:hypothetical protein MBM_02858 [Drepanopeziza brunnea f. sp. 'multigermtubi' MB_m1]|uniref:F-box domain-containing protein n=1 Tax=Marssonina brunnea f. sp. multigermtubi (strain MB_m1) TaxID=1072389 RepID=K1X0D5_MARBU|nr:uncharacterized protein MBM_02858 [Drepanopeziza brunnea f. sp. 'multigermtubi' MB_m1]EKD18616.1 hypothetical protein MBM_02858 [Drepanopeziza brunnea f. sp. 'multigermtubi' MB_m1]
MSFPLFTLFPAEVQGLVMEQCPPNDRVCLSLTCKSLYNLSTLSKPIDLETTDMGHGPLCCSHTDSDWTSRWQHRRDCHKLSYETICRRNESIGRRIPEMKNTCRTRWASNHCECFTRRMRLHLRLKGWMPRGLGYCGECGKFTKRKRGHQGTCELISSPDRTVDWLLADCSNVNERGRSSWQTQRADLEAKFLDAYIAWRSIWEEGLEEVV